MFLSKRGVVAPVHAVVHANSTLKPTPVKAHLLGAGQEPVQSARLRGLNAYLVETGEHKW